MKNTLKTLSINGMDAVVIIQGSLRSKLQVLKSAWKLILVPIIAIGMAACASLTIVSVDWDSLKGPEKTRQYIGVSNQQVTVYANYKDESRKEVAFFTVTHDRDRTGIQPVTVKVLGQDGTGTFQTEVMELTGIRVDKRPTKTSYTVGDKADLSGIRVTGSWRDLPDAELYTYQIEVAGFDSSSAGNKNVTVSFKGKTATFPVTVTAAAATASTPAPTTTTPSTQQPSSSTFNPAPNQPSPVGTWRTATDAFGFTEYRFNADGTGTMRKVSIEGIQFDFMELTWTASGNSLKINYMNYTYEISGNTLTMLWGTRIETYTRR